MDRLRLHYICLFLFLVASCGNPEKPIADLTPTIIEDPALLSDTPTVLSDSLAAQTPVDTPDTRFQPPGYHVFSPITTISIDFFQLPDHILNKQALVFWNEVSDYEGYFDYLTLDGETGHLIQISDDKGTGRFYRPRSSRDGNLLALTHATSQNGENRVEIFLFDIINRTSSGFSFDDPEYGFFDWIIQEDFVVIASEVESGIAFGGRYYYFIPISHPDNVIRIEGNAKRPVMLNLDWNAEQTAAIYSDIICIFDLDSALPICLELKDLVFGNFVSPDKKWLEVRQIIGTDWTANQPGKIGLIPYACIGNQDDECAPSWLPINQISTNWRADCKSISYGFWSPDGNYLYFQVSRPGGLPGNDPGRDCQGDWSGQELWRYSPASGDLEMLKKYDDQIEIFALGNHPNSEYPEIWLNDNEHFVATERNQYGSCQIYLVSSRDGEISLVGEIQNLPVGSLLLGAK